jgi:hypothetical protein
MAKFRIGNGQQPPTPPSVPSNVGARSAARAAGVKAKPAVNVAQLEAPDAPSTDRTQTEGLRHQVKAGLVRLEQAYYGAPSGESSLLKLIGGPAEQASVPDHVIAHHAKRFEQDLGLPSDKAKALVADLALVLA